MKFIALTLLSVVGLARADQQFSVGMDVTIDGATGNPSDPKCIAAAESAVLSAYTAAYPNDDEQLVSIHFNDVHPDYLSTGLGTMGSYTYGGSGDVRCRRCKPLSASFVSKEALLQAVGTTDAFEDDILSGLKASDCNCFKKISDVKVEWIRSGLELDVSGAPKEQHFDVGLDVTIDGATGNPSDPKCIAAVESVVLSAYAAAYPNDDEQLDSIHFNDVHPDYLSTGLGTMGSYTYGGSGDVRCRRCKPLSASFVSKEALLQAVGTTDAFEDDILSGLKASDCNCFKKISDVKVEWIRSGLELDVSGAPKEQHFDVGLDVTIDGATGNPSDPKCIAAVESVVLSAYAAAYPNDDEQLDSIHFNDVKPDFSLKNLRVATMGSYTYGGSGDVRCRRCKPLSASFLSKEALLQAVGTTDAFEADILSGLKTSDCNCFKKISDVTVEWIRGGADVALDVANA